MYILTIKNTGLFYVTEVSCECLKQRKEIMENYLANKRIQGLFRKIEENLNWEKFLRIETIHHKNFDLGGSVKLKDVVSMIEIPKYFKQLYLEKDHFGLVKFFRVKVWEREEYYFRFSEKQDVIFEILQILAKTDDEKTFQVSLQNLLNQKLIIASSIKE